MSAPSAASLGRSSDPLLIRGPAFAWLSLSVVEPIEGLDFAKAGKTLAISQSGPGSSPSFGTKIVHTSALLTYPR